LIVSILNLIMLIVPFIILCYCKKILEEIREIKNKMIGEKKKKKKKKIMVVGNRILMFIRTKKTEEYQPSVFFALLLLIYHHSVTYSGGE
jgi:hypothetical protein